MKIFILFAFCIVFQINDSIAVYWVPGSNGSIPDGAILSGSDKGGVPLYTCRAWYNSNLIPGKLTAVNGGCNIAYNGQEVKIVNYDVAVGVGTFFTTSKVQFLLYTTSAEGGFVPSQQKVLYICRASIDGNLSVGKLEDTKCWIGYGGGQSSFATGYYDILTHEYNAPIFPA